LAELWDVEYEAIATAYRIVEAETEEEARAIAQSDGIDEGNVSAVHDPRIVGISKCLPVETSDTPS